MTGHRSQRLRRARPVLVLAAVAFAVGAIAGASAGTPARYGIAERFAADWAHGRYAAMHAELSTASRRDVSAAQLASECREALLTATATRASVIGRARAGADGTVTVALRVRTRLFGTLSLSYALPFEEASSSTPGVAWSRSLAFPGVARGATLSRDTELPRRAPLLTREGSVLAEAIPGNPTGTVEPEATRPSPLGAVADAVLGTVGPVPTSRRRALEEEGVPPNAIVGLSGLELADDARLRGTPGGELLAGTRVLATAAAHAAPPLRTSVSPALQEAAVKALGGQLGGVIAMKPQSGQILAVAGIGLDGLQPPGSTFKMVTTTGVLSARIANVHTVFPYATHATLDGVKLSNANGEECGGTLELAFAVSCNSVFTPLGVRLGATRLVATAERFGFNHPSAIPGAAESTLPPAGDIQGELDIGSTAIGQGEVLASPLQMALVAATIADGGVRPRPTFLLDPSPHTHPRAMSGSVARTMRHLMIAVVREGTGTAAAIPGVTVAGKTGTAELKSACPSTGGEGAAGESSTPKEGCAAQGAESEAANTDAWFAAFAPALHPRIVVCVLMVKDGAGGATAAPVAREVIEAALSEKG